MQNSSLIKDQFPQDMAVRRRSRNQWVHLGELSQVSRIYHAHIQIETTKQKHSISGGKIGFLKRLVSSTILVLSIRIKYCRFVCTIYAYSQKPVLQVKLLD